MQTVVAAEVFSPVWSDEALLRVRVAGADPSCHLGFLEVLSGGICMTRRLKKLFRAPSFCRISTSRRGRLSRLRRAFDL